MADVEPIFALIDANRAYLRRWLPWLDGVAQVGDTRTQTETTLAAEADGKLLVLVIKRDGEIGGFVSFNTINLANRSGQLGYWLREDWQGRGVVTASCRALLKYGFEELDLNRVLAGVAVQNTRSRAVLERLGFGQYGVVPDAEWLYDHFVDHAEYVLLRRGWEKAQQGDTR